MTHFNALDFLMFFACVAVLTRFCRDGTRERILAVFCALFVIAATNEFVFLILLLFTAIFWRIGRLLQDGSRTLAGRFLLAGTLLGLWIFTLLSSRYDWLQWVGERLIGMGGPARILPLRSSIVVWSSRVGISFFALRVSSYLVQTSFRPERLPFVSFFVYLFYFPAFIAGPVDHPWEFEQKLSRWENASGREWFLGGERFVSGLFKKFVLADLLKPYTIAQLPIELAGRAELWTGLLLYSLFIYWEFSGYTDMALGISQCLGLKLPENFDRPYRKGDLTEFWNSWHMSFSAWLRDFIFAPVNLWLGRRLSLSSSWAPVPALLVTMVFCGAWHGYTAGFLLWGLHHGMGLSAHRLYQAAMRGRLGRKAYRELTQRRLYMEGCRLATFLYVTLGWGWFVWPADQAGHGMLRLLGGG